MKRALLVAFLCLLPFFMVVGVGAYQTCYQDKDFTPLTVDADSTTVLVVLDSVGHGTGLFLPRGTLILVPTGK